MKIEMKEVNLSKNVRITTWDVMGLILEYCVLHPGLNLLHVFRIKYNIITRLLSSLTHGPIRILSKNIKTISNYITV